MQMKKAEIKRRKRVVPNDSSQYGSPGVSDLIDDDTSTQADMRASMAPSAISSAYEQRGPIPVDFTDTFRNHSLAHRHRETEHNEEEEEHDYRQEEPPASTRRKRSFSTSTRGDDGEGEAEREHKHGYEHGPYHHAQNVDHRHRASSPRDENIDPALAASVGGASTETKESRRAELQREAERMRRMLVEKERELAELG